MIEYIEDNRLSPGEESRLLAGAKYDPDAFGRLYQAYVRPVYRYIYFRVGSAMDAEDLTSQVFSQAMENLGRYRHQGRFLGWLLAIARRRAADFFRNAKPVENLDFVEPLLARNAGALEDEQADRLRELVGVVGKLGEDERELLRLRFAAGLSFQEMAEALNCGEEAAKKRFYRTIERIKNHLTETGGGVSDEG